MTPDGILKYQRPCIRYSMTTSHFANENCHVIIQKKKEYISFELMIYKNFWKTLHSNALKAHIFKTNFYSQVKNRLKKHFFGYKLFNKKNEMHLMKKTGKYVWFRKKFSSEQRLTEIAKENQIGWPWLLSRCAYCWRFSFMEISTKFKFYVFRLMKSNCIYRIFSNCGEFHHFYLTTSY